MGALHAGHISLIAKAKTQCDFVLCSIFVNPTQFNDPKDLEMYPRHLEEDIKLLEAAGCHALLSPNEDEMYPDGRITIPADYGLLTNSLEGAFRPGHFEGVVTIVQRLFQLCQPDAAYFGEKDFQQLAVVREMVRRSGFSIDIVACPIAREKNGLAMSSRNERLSPVQREVAGGISKTLFQMKARSNDLDPENLMRWGKSEIRNYKGIQLEYLEIVDAETFAPSTHWVSGRKHIALVALKLGNVRLIDNLLLR